MIRLISFSRLQNYAAGAAASLLLLTSGAGPLLAAKPADKSAATATGYQPPAYFYTIELDPRYQFLGVGALSPEDAEKANCYQFLYNSNGKLQQIEYTRAGKPMADPLLGVARINFEYQPGIERRWFRDAQGQPTADYSGVDGEELTLNAAGFPTDLTNLDAQGARARDSSGVMHHLRVLDDHNRLIVGRRIGVFGNAITDDNGYFETRNVYDADGRLMERGNFDADGKRLDDTDGIAIVRTIYTIYPDSTKTTETYYDASELPAAEKSSGVHQRETTVDKRGLLIDEAVFDTTGAPTDSHGDGIHEHRYTYDDLGNQTSESFFDNDGKPVNDTQLDCARIEYKYNDKNLIVEKDFFGDDGTPQVLPGIGAAIIRQEYDADGNVVRRQFFDGQGQPSRQTEFGAPAIRIKVDGDTTLVTLRDDKDQPMRDPVHGYYAFSYKVGDTPLSPHNRYYDRSGHALAYFPRVSIINPHLHALRTNRTMKWSARLGTIAVLFGSLLGCALALRKSSYAKRHKVYIPTRLERVLGWLSIFLIIEGMLRFFLTVYWWWVNYENGRMGHGIYVLEAIIILYFLYRLLRLRVTMRVLNISRDDIHKLVRDYYAKAGLKADWIQVRRRYYSGPLDVRISYFKQKFHAYLAFYGRGREGHDLARGAAQYIRTEAARVEGPARTMAIALYYPIMAFCYFLLASTAAYTLYQLVKSF